MGRRRTIHLDLPPQMQRKGRHYYYGRRWIPLGADFQAALKEWARLHGETVVENPATFADAVRRYRLSEDFSSKAPKTQSEYSRQLATLSKVFGRLPLSAITPQHVKRYMALRPKIAGTREKALLSLVFILRAATDSRIRPIRAPGSVARNRDAAAT